MIFRSAEARWFIPGSLPDEALNRFQADRPLEPEGTQVHEYLVLPDCPSVGVKLREGRFEIKAILEPPRPLSPDLPVKGRTDRWVKWSLASEGLQTLDPALHRSDTWLAVSKERFLRRFSGDTGRLVEVMAPPGSFPGSGVNLELSRIGAAIKPRSWFSLAFEAFGPPAVVDQLLLDALRLFFKDHDPVPGMALEEANSLSYPAWLAKVVQPR